MEEKPRTIKKINLYTKVPTFRDNLTDEDRYAKKYWSRVSLEWNVKTIKKIYYKPILDSNVIKTSTTEMILRYDKLGTYQLHSVKVWCRVPPIPSLKQTESYFKDTLIIMDSIYKTSTIGDC
jgi:hypothetical protein